MTLADTSNGPGWVIWAVFILIGILSALLLSGHGKWLIAGYNTASEKEREKYDAKKLCRTVGAGLAVADVIILIMELFEDVLPASFAGIAAMLIFADCLVMVILGNTICKKKNDRIDKRK